MYGYTGCILRVNLSTGRVTKEPVSADFARKFLGGAGFGAKILFDELKPGIDPLGPENKLLFMTGPVTGVPIAGNSRVSVMAKSPESGGWGESNAGGYWPRELKMAGFDGVIVEGASANPVYLWIHDGEAEIRDVGELWGKRTYETMSAIKKLFPALRVEVACIGPTGENLVKYAGIIFDYGAAAARMGLGTVMGSKKLKAIAVHGNRKIEVAKTKDMTRMIKRWITVCKVYPRAQEFRKYGTTWPVYPKSMPTRNMQSAVFPNANVLSGESLKSKGILVGSYTCFACPIGCKHFAKLNQGSYEGFYDFPEATVTMELGWAVGNDNVELLVHASHLCMQYGLDIESTGPVIAFAMECYQRGILTERDVGFELKWGDHKAIIKTIKLIAERKGIGDLLAEGVKRISEKLGKGSSDFAMHVKGIEMEIGCFHDVTSSFGFATSPRGAHHCDGPCTSKPLIGQQIDRDLRTVLNSMVVCRFIWPSRAGWLNTSFWTPNDLVDVLNYTTGWDLDLKELMLIGERSNNLKRAFNVREGFTRKDDTLPKRSFEPFPDGTYKGKRSPEEQGIGIYAKPYPPPLLGEEEFKSMLDEFYKLRGWDVETGIPTRKKLVSLGLTEAADQLSRLGYLPGKKGEKKKKRVKS